MAAMIVGYEIIPCSPGPAPARQDSFISVQYRFVVLITNRAEDACLNICGIGKHAQGLITVARDKHVIEFLSATPLRDELYVIRETAN